MSQGVTSPSFDSQFDALGHVDRRRLLFALLDANAEDTLPVEIGQLEHDTAESSLRLSMHHVHLPKLDAQGFVDADLNHDAVTTGPQFNEIKPLLELLYENRERLPDDWR